MKTVISSKGQIVLPAELRKKDRIRPGQKFKIERVKAGEYLISKEKKKKSEPANKGLVDWLLACPEKGFFDEEEVRKPLKQETTAEWAQRIERMFSE